jgi:hypothetical protein
MGFGLHVTMWQAHGVPDHRSACVDPKHSMQAVPGMPGGSAAELAAGGWHAASPQPLPPALRLPCAAGPAPYRAALVRFTRCAMAAIVRRQQLLEQDEEWFGMQKRTPSAAAAAPVDWVCARAPARYLRLLLHSPSPAEDAPTENCWKFRTRWWSYGQLLWRRSSHVADAPGVHMCRPTALRNSIAARSCTPRRAAKKGCSCALPGSSLGSAAPARHAMHWCSP